jgi:hypothetical protein
MVDVPWQEVPSNNGTPKSQKPNRFRRAGPIAHAPGGKWVPSKSQIDFADRGRGSHPAHHYKISTKGHAHNDTRSSNSQTPGTLQDVART